MTAMYLSGSDSSQWRRWAPLLMLVAIALLFRDTVAAMVSIWIRSETFQHAFLVPPIVAWLVWRRREELARIQMRPMPWMLGPIAATCALWLLGELAEVAAASQLALVALMVMTIPALYGEAMTRALAFPLAFSFFSVPIGEFAVPYLQEWTADVTVFALKATGIPVYREGMQFIIPSGTWSVVAACSGIRYLLACFMVGTLYGYLNFRTTRRQLTFAVVALVVPILANWVRAYSIVMIGHVTGSPMIFGVEHTTYGWVLFGIIVMLMFVVAARWADEAPSPTASAAAEGGGSTHAAAATQAPASSGRHGAWVVAAAMLGVLTGAQAWAWTLAHRGAATAPAVALPEGASPWRGDPAVTSMTWPPGFVGPSATAFRSYTDERARVDAWIGYYRHQDEDRKLVSSINRVVSTEGERWRFQATGQRGTSGLPAFSTGIVSRGGAPTLGRDDRDRVWQAYWVNGRWVTSPAEAKIRQALGRLAGHGDDGAVLLLATRWSDDADVVLEEFARAHLAAVETSLRSTRELR